MDKIGVSSLRNIGILYEGDLYDLACLLLKVDDASDKGTQTKTRHTVRGLATKYSMLANMDFNQVMAVITRYDLPLGATVEYDEDIICCQPSENRY